METLRMDQTQWWNNHEGKASATATPFVGHDVISSYQLHSIVTYSAMTPHGTQLLHRGKQANASNLDDFQEIIVLQALLVDLCYMDILYRYKYSCLSLFVAEKVEILSFHLMCNNNLLIPESLLTIHCAKIFEMQTIRILVLVMWKNLCIRTIKIPATFSLYGFGWCRGAMKWVGRILMFLPSWLIFTDVEFEKFTLCLALNGAHLIGSIL